jgi:hypothetical protein
LCHCPREGEVLPVFCGIAATDGRAWTMLACTVPHIVPTLAPPARAGVSFGRHTWEQKNSKPASPGRRTVQGKMLENAAVSPASTACGVGTLLTFEDSLPIKIPKFSRQIYNESSTLPYFTMDFDFPMMSADNFFCYGKSQSCAAQGS